MKLAEALIERSELQKENAILLDRIKDNLQVQEGDLPVEAPEKLISQYEHNMERLSELVSKINKTNSKTEFNDGMSIADVIAMRDCLETKQRAYLNMYVSTKIKSDRYSHNEIKFVRCMDPKILQKQIDIYGKKYRELDTKLQGMNWTVDLI